LASARVSALGGAIFFVLIVLNANQLNGAPSATDPATEIFDFLARHHERFQVGAVLLGLAMPAALLWLSGLVRALRGAEGRTSGLTLTAFAGGVLAAAATVTSALIEGTTANRVDDLGRGGARVWWTMYLMSFGATLLGLLVLIGASAAVCLQTRLFARWFAVASAVLALASLVGAFTVGYANAALQTVAGIAIVLDSAWILVVSYFLWRDPTLAAAGTTAGRAADD
jgi:hypothetical protein